MSTSPEHGLPCGRDSLSVWENARNDTHDQHEATCPYCQGVYEQFRILAIASDPYLAQAITAPPSLIATAMRTVLAELRPGRPLPIPSDAGPAFITDTALAAALRAALDADPAVITHRCRIDTVDLPETVRSAPNTSTQQPTPPPLAVQLSVAVSYEHYTRHGESVVRTRVIDTGRNLFAQQIDTVDIEIIDVFSTEVTQ